MLDLMQIKDALEDIYNIEFKVMDMTYMEGQELVWQKGKDKVRVHIGHYTCKGREGQEFMDFDWWDGTTGLGSPCDSMEQLTGCFDRIKVPRRTVPRERREQLSLF